MRHMSIELVQVNNGYIIQVPGGQITIHNTYDEMETELKNLLDTVNGRGKEAVAPAEEVEAPKKEKKKPAKKEAKEKEEPVEEEEVEEVNEDDLTLDHVREALRDYAKENDKAAAKALMKEVAGVTKMDDIPEDKYADVILACEAAEDDE